MAAVCVVSPPLQEEQALWVASVVAVGLLFPAVPHATCHHRLLISES